MPHQAFASGNCAGDWGLRGAPASHARKVIVAAGECGQLPGILNIP